MLTITNMEKHYGKIAALKEVSLTIPSGSCYGLVGPNGAGKSTLIKILASIIHDYKGEALINEILLNHDLKEKIGYIPQDICLEEDISAIGNLHFFGKLYGIKGKQLLKRTQEVLRLVGLSERSKDKVNTFSGGMKRRLNIGCALMHQPDLIIMDEPTVGIDPQSRRYIFQMIEDFKNAGCTIIYASHYMEEVEELCDHVAFIDKGEIVENGSVAELLQKYAIPSIYIKGSNITLEVVEKYGTASTKKGGYLLQTNEPLQVMENIILYCRENNIELERLELVQPRLEDVFFTLTGSKLRD
ncbi:ABC transporter ATP-binding protein [Virgibacillus profundi]|uniref:ABC transporter ATP-binding protein n=1 Tax=Virgibacillus profundi TaxID=2024555 RepID=A0A2A2IFT0_9BACI|nr:ABC transporter ATP-binding protein [Virgibacillus profundi]PAV30507.1 ABC transporter ATP-binding protein [Virgibacillus profundi]PXY54679.1 ABC transporter ATP-binding protein [Virgibacillus profundi]